LEQVVLFLVGCREQRLQFLRAVRGDLLLGVLDFIRLQQGQLLAEVVEERLQVRDAVGDCARALLLLAHRADECEDILAIDLLETFPLDGPGEQIQGLRVREQRLLSFCVLDLAQVFFDRLRQDRPVWSGSIVNDLDADRLSTERLLPLLFRGQRKLRVIADGIPNSLAVRRGVTEKVRSFG
jgi:hypothetical protein